MPKKLNEKTLPKEGEETPEMNAAVKRLISKADRVDNLNNCIKLPLDMNDVDFVDFMKKFPRTNNG